MSDIIATLNSAYGADIEKPGADTTESYDMSLHTPELSQYWLNRRQFVQAVEVTLGDGIIDGEGVLDSAVDIAGEGVKDGVAAKLAVIEAVTKGVAVDDAEIDVVGLGVEEVVAARLGVTDGVVEVDSDVDGVGLGVKEESAELDAATLAEADGDAPDESDAVGKGVDETDGDASEETVGAVDDDARDEVEGVGGISCEARGPDRILMRNLNLGVQP